MSVITSSPFDSKYGFKSPGFTVDSNGNIIAASITLATDNLDPATPADFTVTSSANDFVFSTLGTNPTITLVRSRTYIIDLNLTSVTFAIYDDDQTTLYSENLRHSDGTSGGAAQGKSSGRLVFTVPVTAPDTLYYGLFDTSVINGTFLIVDPEGTFSRVTINENILSTSSTTGSLVVAGGVGIAGDLYIEGNFNVGGAGIPNIISPTNLVLGADNKIDIQINDILVGYVNNLGSTIPVHDTTVLDSSINNTVIGDVTPATAAFTRATVSIVDSPVSVANKQYVDITATSLSIAFGL